MTTMPIMAAQIEELRLLLARNGGGRILQDPKECNDLGSNDMKKLYMAENTSWGAQKARRARVIAIPHSAQGVAACVQWCTSNALSFTCRSGGNNSQMASPCDVVISLSSFDHVFVEKNPGTIGHTAERSLPKSSTTTITIGTGQKWQHVYEMLAGTGLTVLGGRSRHVGVGGYSLGGGLSFLTPLYGLLAGSIVDAEVVLASGEIVRAVDDPELLFALRGCGSNFGIVTELTLKAYEQPTWIWSGNFVFSAVKVGQQIAKAVLAWNKANSDLRGSLCYSVVKTPDGQHLIDVHAYYLGAQDEAMKHFSWLHTDLIQSIDPGHILKQHHGMMSYLDLHSVADGAQGLRDMGYYQSSVLPRDFTPAMMAALLDTQQALWKDQGLASIALVEPYPENTYSSNVDAAWSLPLGRTTVVGLIVLDSSPAKTFSQVPCGLALDQMRKAIVDARADADEMTLTEGCPGSGLHYRFPNYCFQHETGESYFTPESLTRLRRTKARLDPRDLFRGVIAI